MDEKVHELLERVKSTADFGYVEFHSINDTNALGDNALHCVCVWDDFDAVALLVENGINVNQIGEEGFTPLDVARDFSRKSIIDLLVANDAISGAQSEGFGIFDHEKHALHLQKITENIKKLEQQIDAECT